MKTPWLLLISLCALVVQECGADFYPPVFWHSQNCVFRQLRESYGKNESEEFFMKVLPYNAINIVCPNQLTVNDWLGSQFPDGMYENMWMVDKSGFDNCIVNPNVDKKILDCKTPDDIKFTIFRFHNSYNTEEPKFAPGHHYYFISTSKGEIEDLNMKSGGHCKSDKMKLHIYVCDPKKEDCVWEMPRCEPPYRMMKLMKKYSLSLPPPTRARVTVRKPTTTKENKPTTKEQKVYSTKVSATEVHSTKEQDTNNHEASPHGDKTAPSVKCIDEDEGTSIHLILNFVLGGVILFMAIVIIILACGLARKSGDSKNRPSSVAFSALAQEPSAHLYEETARFGYPPLTPTSRSLPQTPLTNNPPFFLPPMSEIRAKSPSSKSGFNNTVYNQRRHSYDASPATVEASPMLSEGSGENSAEAV